MIVDECASCKVRTPPAAVHPPCFAKHSRELLAPQPRSSFHLGVIHIPSPDLLPPSSALLQGDFDVDMSIPGLEASTGFEWDRKLIECEQPAAAGTATCHPRMHACPNPAPPPRPSPGRSLLTSTYPCPCRGLYQLRWLGHTGRRR